MKTLKMQFYNNVNPSLKKYISHYWTTSGDLNDKRPFQLIPMDHVDITVPLNGSYTFELKGQAILVNKSIFHGLRDSTITVSQNKSLDSFGISFTPWGFYYLYNDSLHLINNKILYLSQLDTQLDEVINRCIESHSPIVDMIEAIENYLISYYKTSKHYTESIEIIEDYINTPLDSVKEYCQLKNIQRKKLERIFKKYVGLSPKEFKALSKFENTSRSILYKDDITLTDLAYESQYYDQAHFTKTFKNYTDYTPSKFKEKKPALKSIIEFK